MARVLVDSAVELLHDALMPLDRWLSVLEHVADDGQEGEPARH
jgi:hypothetical protein